MYECKKSDQYDTADVPTYEEVTPYRRQMNENYRLVVLVGKWLFCVCDAEEISETVGI